MAKTKNFAFSMDAHGKIGHNLVAQKGKGMQVCKNWSAPGGSPSDLQIEKRKFVASMQDAINIAKAEEGYNEQQWKFTARKQRKPTTPMALLTQATYNGLYGETLIQDPAWTRFRVVNKKETRYFVPYRIRIEECYLTSLQAYSSDEKPFYGEVVGNGVDKTGEWAETVSGEFYFDLRPFEYLVLQVIDPNTGRWCDLVPYVRIGLDIF